MPLEFRETLTDMSLGIVDNVTPDQIPDNAVADALNMVFDKRQQLRTRPGCSVLNPNHNLDNANSSTIDGDDVLGQRLYALSFRSARCRTRAICCND